MPKPEPVRQQQQRAGRAGPAPAAQDLRRGAGPAPESLSLDKVNWRAAALAAGRLLVAIATRDIPGAFAGLLALAQAFGVGVDWLGLAYAVQYERLAAAGVAPPAPTDAKTLEERIDSAAAGE